MPVGNQKPTDVADSFSALQFIIQQKLSEISTLALVRIVSCTNEGGIVPVGTVVVQPLVSMMSGDRVAFKHKPLYDLPYCRVQGGKNAVIIDPQPGDIGVAGFCSRDISAAKASQDIAPPGSYRQFSMADGIYLFTCMGADAPEQYFAMSEAGIKVLSPVLIEMQAPTIRIKGTLEQTDGDVTMSQKLTVEDDIKSTSGDVVATTVSLRNHLTSGVTSGIDISGPPVP